MRDLLVLYNVLMTSEATRTMLYASAKMSIRSAEILAAARMIALYRKKHALAAELAVLEQELEQSYIAD